MKDTALVIMAAGIGSRFGKGTKQLTPVGPSGELIIDYSIHDAIRAGFNKVVFIIRRDILDEFRSAIGDRISKVIDTEYVFQELDDLPAGFKKPEGRIKPWGTGQAVLCCRGVVKTPFAVINADDYYGVDTYKIIHDYISKEHESRDGVQDICMAGFRLGNTLSDNGAVTRGICIVDAENRLMSIDETKNIEKCDKGGIVRSEAGDRIIDASTPVSMNMWGFSPDFIPLLETGFTEFLKDLPDGDITGEFLLPTYIDRLLKENRAEVRVLETPAEWFGVTYQEDREPVRQAFKELVAKGIYKEKLY